MEPKPVEFGRTFRQVPFRKAPGFWLRLGLTSFGGPAGQIAMIRAELVERRRWITEPQFLNAVNFCVLLPGPEAQQLATYLGWLLSGTAGGVAAGTLFVLPSALLLWLLSWACTSSSAVRRGDLIQTSTHLPRRDNTGRDQSAFIERILDRLYTGPGLWPCPCARLPLGINGSGRF